MTTGAMDTSLATSKAMCIAFVGPVFPGNSPLSRLGERLITRAPSCGIETIRHQEIQYIHVVVTPHGSSCTVYNPFPSTYPADVFMLYLGSDGLYHHRFPRTPRAIQHDRFQVVLRFQRGLELPEHKAGRQAGNERHIHTFSHAVEVALTNPAFLQGFFKAGRRGVI